MLQDEGRRTCQHSLSIKAEYIGGIHKYSQNLPNKLQGYLSVEDILLMSVKIFRGQCVGLIQNADPSVATVLFTDI